MKKWYQSKFVWLGIVQTLIGALGVLAEFLQKSDFSPFAVTILFSGILTVIVRVWFTQTQIDTGAGNG